MKTVNLSTQLCIVGGGIAGINAALSAARNNIKVTLVHDRSVLGGNASSEVRMWICGASARGKNMRETGIIEEILLDNNYYNPSKNMSIFDSILYGKVQYQENITLLLNCVCFDLTKENDKIKKIRCFQSNAQTFYNITSDLFADCSGDSILGVLSNATMRRGRESSAEFSESIEPNKSDNYTMGSSCLFHARESNKKSTFIPPTWANKYTSLEQLTTNRGNYKITPSQNFWYIETGGTSDTIYDVDKHREKLLKIVFGIWDYMKNYSPEKEDNAYWEIDWVGFLPGKRESHRIVGDCLLNQNDVRNEGKFNDIVAYGGWSMDDHHPDGFDYPGEPTIFHDAPSPFGIPYRSLYSVNVTNLFCAGRNISVTHAALSSVRVMATCATIGQAVGTAASIAIQQNTSPRGVNDHINDLQQKLLFDDSYLPWIKRELSALTKSANIITSSNCDSEILRDSFDRPVGDDNHLWNDTLGNTIIYEFKKTQFITNCRLVFDSNLNRKELNLIALRYLNSPDLSVPKTLIKDYDIDFLDENKQWQTLKSIRNNYQRLQQHSLNISTCAIRFKVLSTWDTEAITYQLFSIDLY